MWEREGGREEGLLCREEEVDWKWEGGSWIYTVSFIVPFDVADRFQNYFCQVCYRHALIKHCTCINSRI